MRTSLGPTRQLGDPAKIWSLVDETPFDAIYLADHFSTSLPDPWTLLAHGAAMTNRIKLGTHVVGAPFHDPARLAAQVATVDALSNGRARLGIGTGHQRLDFEPYGYHWQPMAGRIDQMRDAIETIKRLWTDPQLPFPSPVQLPHPPIIIGLNTPGRAMRVALDLADGINTWQLGPGQVAELRGHLADSGCDFARFELTADVLLRREATEDDARSIAEAVADASSAGGRGSAATHWDASGVLWGEASHVAEQVSEFARVGVDELALSGTLDDSLWFAEKVMPQLM
jgi:alkanesulfonate monooxygenase SsuD/methylene tetrahydromethanopterin reductase-like flavin-dependent oxidoreductase (luciferase family)